jgi:tripartite-type tricarboxylate transporter receptor subunit TctC
MNAKIATLLLSAVIAAPAVAQTYPSGPIRIIVPYAAGGLTDALARVTGAEVAAAVNQPVIVENRPGASSIIGMEACANAKPDGHTVCLTVADSLSIIRSCSRISRMIRTKASRR